MKKKYIFIVLITIIILCIAIILILNINKLPKTITNNEGVYIEMTNKKQDDFQIDLVYHSTKNRNIHYHAYIPDNIEKIKNIKMYITLPGYEGLYFQGVGANLAEDFAFTAKELNPNMIILAPQLDDWGKQSASDTIELTEYYKELYKIDRIYINGYSGGGETLSLVLEEKPELYNRALLVSSQWDGKYDNLIKSETPLYLFTGENDSYYGSDNFKKTYKELYDLYFKKGLSKDYIDKILILDIKNHEYFTSHGVNDEHGGGNLAAHEESIMKWLLELE